MSLTATVNSLAAFPDGTALTNAALRKGFSATIAGTVGTSDLEAGAVTPAKTTPGAYEYAGGTLSAGVYSIALSPALPAYVAGAVVRFKASAANTGAIDLNVNSLGAKNLFKWGATELAAGDIRTDQLIEAQYDGTNFQMLNPFGQPNSYYATGVGGTSTAVTATIAPVPASYNDIIGVPVRFIAYAGTTSSTLTLNLNSLGAKTVKKNFSTASFQEHDIDAGQMVEVIYDGTYFQMQSQLGQNSAAPAIRDKYRKLSMSSAGGTTVVSPAAAEIILENSSGNTVVLRSFAPQDCNLTTASAVHGRENGTALSTRWYHIWAVSDGTLSNSGTMASTNESGGYPTPPTLPGGYTNFTYNAYLGSVYYNSGTGNITPFIQYDDEVFTAEQVAFTAQAAAGADTWETKSISTIVPIGIASILGYAGTTTAANMVLALAAYAVGATVFGPKYLLAAVSTAYNTVNNSHAFELRIVTSQTFYWKCLNTTANNRVVITGWKYPK